MNTGELLLSLPSIAQVAFVSRLCRRTVPLIRDENFTAMRQSSSDLIDAIESAEMVGRGIRGSHEEQARLHRLAHRIARSSNWRPVGYPDHPYPPEGAMW